MKKKTKFFALIFEHWPGPGLWKINRGLFAFKISRWFVISAIKNKTAYSRAEYIRNLNLINFSLYLKNFYNLMSSSFDDAAQILTIEDVKIFTIKFVNKFFFQRFFFLLKKKIKVSALTPKLEFWKKSLNRKLVFKKTCTIVNSSVDTSKFSIT